MDFLVPAVVMTAVDTRPSSERLCAAIVAGVEAIGGAVVNMGLLTTPQLHYLLSLKNSGVGDVSESLYFAKLCESYMALVDGECDAVKSYQTEVYVDGANGVGALKMNALAQCWPEKRLESSNRLRVHVRNDGTTGSLNLRCGADFVKVQQKKPEGFDDVAPLAKCASFDGDADRLMYFYTDAESGLVRLVGEITEAYTAKTRFFISTIFQTETKLQRYWRRLFANGLSLQKLTSISAWCKRPTRMARRPVTS